MVRFMDKIGGYVTKKEMKSNIKNEFTSFETKGNSHKGWEEERRKKKEERRKKKEERRKKKTRNYLLWNKNNKKRKKEI